MRVTLIGSGNVATVLGRRMVNAAHIIHQVYSRNSTHAEILAAQLSATAAAQPEEIDQSADLYVIAISDSALLSVGEWLHLNDRLVVHTGGSIPMDALKNVSTNYGVLYPLQTIRKESEPVLPILADGNNPWNRTKVAAFAQSFADTVGFANDEQRSKLHLAAVVTNNFSNYLFSLAEEYCHKEHIDFNMIVPLLEETVKRLSYASPSEMQTGPAVRNDQVTIEKHKQMLSNYPGFLKVYEFITSMIQVKAARK